MISVTTIAIAIEVTVARSNVTHSATATSMTLCTIGRFTNTRPSGGSNLD